MSYNAMFIKRFLIQSISVSNQSPIDYRRSALEINRKCDGKGAAKCRMFK
jgi:hypothetical protein